MGLKSTKMSDRFTPAMRIKVAIVEDDPILRRFMEEAVLHCEDLELNGGFGNAEDFLKEPARIRDLDVVVMDINLPGMNGIRCIEKIREMESKPQFLVCTIFEDSMHLFNALCAGATGYILKSAGEEEIIKAIRDIHDGGSPMSPQIARMVVNSIPARKNNVRLLDTLTEREQQILTLLASGYMYKEIADKLNLSVQTVRSYIRDIYSKLQVHSRMEAVNKLYK